MRPITLFGILGVFAFLAFVPPSGMSKYPARIEFQLAVPQSEKVITAEWEAPQFTQDASAKEEEDSASDS